MNDLALAASLRAATLRRANSGLEALPLTLQPADLRRRVRAARIPNLILLVVDASGSMAARGG
jgi:Mg-chelatase subunit ChlD